MKIKLRRTKSQSNKDRWKEGKMEKHREKMFQVARKMGLKNKGKKGTKSPKWKGGFKKAIKRWRLKHREQYNEGMRSARHKYKARKQKAKGYFTLAEWELLKKQYNFICPSCNRNESNIKLEPDHIIPLSKGGSNWIENIQPLCRECNAHKHTKIILYANTKYNLSDKNLQSSQPKRDRDLPQNLPLL